MTKNPSIEIRAGDLKPAIAGLGKVIASKAALPVLQCVKVEAPNRSSLRLTATDLSVTLSITVPAKLGEKVEPFLLPLTRLRDLTRQTRADEPLRLGPMTKAPVIGEFPETASAFRASPISLPNTAVTGLMRAFACASHDETRYVLRGAYLDTSGRGKNAHRIVATDGRHLFSSNTLSLPKVKAPVILPDHKLWQWKPIAESRPWTLRLGAAPRKGNGATPFRIDGPFWSIAGNVIDGNFPNYRQVIPNPGEFKTHVMLSEPASAAIAQLIPRMPGKKLANRPVGLHFERGRVGLLARESNDEPWVLHPIDRAGIKGPDLTVFVNRDYLRKAAAFGLGEIALIDAMSPVQFSREGDLMIVMPIRATDPERIERPKLRPLVEPAVEPAVKRQPKVRRKPATSRAKRSNGSKRSITSTKKPSAKPSAKPKPKSKRSDSADPIGEVESRIAEANEALASAGKQLISATGSLKTARRQRSEDQQELRGLRSLFSSIKKIATGSN